MKRKAGHLKLNNDAGFSLVELLIGVTILAIITVPLLHMFVTSNKINAKSRITLRATVVAQDVMEGLKAYRVDELKEQFKGSEALELVSTSMLSDPDVAYYEDTARERAENTADPTVAKPGLYYFVLKNITMEKSRFDVLVKVDAGGYVDASQTDSVTYRNLNNNRVVQIAGVNKETDAYYQQSKTLEESVLADVKDHFHIEADEVTYKTPGLIFDGRTITIRFKDDGTDADGNPKTAADITYAYTFQYGSDTYITYGSASRERVCEQPCGNFTGKNFYLFYYPLYQGKPDTIVFDCGQSNSLDLYIAKQLDTELTDAQLNTAEVGYQAVVNVTGTFDADKFSIRTNLGRNLVNEAFLGEGVSPLIAGQVTYQLNGAAATGLNIYDLAGVRDTAKGAAGADDPVAEFIYDIVVEVYEEGAADAGFPSDMRKVTLDGTKN